MRPSSEHLQTIYTHCRRILGAKPWGRVLAAMDDTTTLEKFPEALHTLQGSLDLPGFIGDLARLEWARHLAAKAKTTFDEPLAAAIVNPSLNLVPVLWQNLASIIETADAQDTPPPEPLPGHVMIWRHPKTGSLHIREADDNDLLALKIVVEQIEPRQAAAEGNVTTGALHAILDRAVDQGLLIPPGSRIRRTVLASLKSPDRNPSETDQKFLAAKTFTLQWHITQACDLHCKHCYDRSERASVPFDTAAAILDGFYEFCRRMHVKGQVTFTGGNPLLYPRFNDIYKVASDLGFSLAILGNPSSMDRIESLLKIQKPSFFQISLEGLAEHNDYIRGSGHFQRSLRFLDQLRQLDIYTMVMLTLTRDNMDQVLPLARLLRHQVDAFNFNRLSAVGEGARLALPAKDDFQRFLRAFEAEADRNPNLGLKDNLINIIRKEKEMPLFGGCTGYGCGAAFNFVALLPDGEVHACRKFPSPIGNMLQNSLLEIYQSELAQRYRTGSEACRDCSLSMVCRGCLAVSYSHDLDIFTEKDPFCFS